MPSARPAAPATGSVPRPSPAVMALGAAVALAVAAFALSTVVPALRRPPFSPAVWDVYVSVAVYAGVAVLCLAHMRAAGAERVAWLAGGAAMTSMALGALAWGWDGGGSLADGFRLAFYPCAYLALLLLLRRRVRHLAASGWLDGIVVGLAATAAFAALAAEPIVAGAGGDVRTKVAQLVYPAGDLLLILLVVTAVSLSGWRLRRDLALLGAGFVCWGVVDTAYLYLDASAKGGVLDVLWPLGALLIGAAAWAGAGSRADGLGDRARLLVPSASTLLAVSVLVVCAAGYGNTIAIVLASAAICAAVARTHLTFSDVRRLSESSRQARTDELTGLANRRGFNEQVDSALLEGLALGHPLALLLLDLDRFKDLNDTLGHQAGDDLLCEVSRRLRRVVPEAPLGRLGGDEFVVLLVGADEEAGRSAAQAMAEVIEAPLELEGLTTHTRVSFGVAVAPAHGRSRAELMRAADIAMYRAKREGDRVAVYSREADEHSRERLALAADLRAALDGAGGLHLHYQPKTDLSTGATIGVEALVRWRHPVRGLQYPEDFVELAEQHGLAQRVTTAVLEEALQQQAAWAEAGRWLPVAVNLSPSDLCDPGFPAVVAAAVARHGVRAGGLELEITENTVMSDPEQTLGVLDELRRLGVRLSLDDFGTGHSSLAHLKRLPVQELKIDREFVQGMLEDPDDAIIVRSTIDLARNLGLVVVAEGVETEEHRVRLARFGCHVAQGFHIAWALSVPELERWLDDRAAAGDLLAEQPPERGWSRPAPGDHAVLAAIMDAATAVLVPGTLVETLGQIARQLGRLVPYDDLVIYELDASGQTLEGLYAEGTWTAEVLADRFPITVGISGATARDRRTHNIARMDLEPLATLVPGTDEAEPESLVSTPLLVQGRTIGVLNLYRLGEDVAFSAAEAETVERFATVAALAYHSAQQREDLREAASRDALTGLSDSRAFSDAVAAHVAQAALQGTALSVAILEYDRSAGVEDLGRQARDRAFRTAAAVLKGAVRADDVVARLGGGAFGLLLPGLGEEEGGAAAERARAALAGTQVDGASLGFMVGHASLDGLQDGATGAVALIAAADRALEEARRAGLSRSER